MPPRLSGLILDSNGGIRQFRITPRPPTLKPRDIIRALERASFEVDHQTGSHVVLRHSKDDSRVVGPYQNRDLGHGLTLRIIKSAGLTRVEFIELLK